MVRLLLLYYIVRLDTLWILIISISTFLSSCVNKHDRQLEYKVHHSLRKATQNNKSVTFRLDTLTDFDWDHFFVIHPYTDLDQLEKQINIHLSGLDTDIEYLDHYSLLIFVKDEEIVRYIEQGPPEGTLSPTVFETGILFDKDELLQLNEGAMPLTDGSKSYYIELYKR